MSGLDSKVLQAALASQLSEINPDILRRLLHVQLQNISPQSRERSAIASVAALNETLSANDIAPLPALPAIDDARMQKHLQEMRANGITLLGPVMNTAQVQDVHRHLDTKNVYGSHVWTFSDRQARPKADIREKHGQACYILDDLLDAPHLLETMSNPFVLKLVEQYLGCVPTVFQSNLMWSFQKKRAQPTIAQAFHRDWDNFRFCVLFVYMTDVNAETGPHQYIRGSHTIEGVKAAIDRYHAAGNEVGWAKIENFYREAKLNDPKVMELFGDSLLQIEQPAGYAFLTDAFGLHRGVPLMEGERLLFWTRFGLYDNGFSADVSPALLPRETFSDRLPQDKTHDYIFRSVMKSRFSQENPPESLHPLANEFAAQSEELITRFGRARYVGKAVNVLADMLRGKKLKPRIF